MVAEISERDRALLATNDMKRMSWAEAQQVLDTGDMRLFRRSPEMLQTYLDAKQRFQAEYGSTAEYVLRERLQWAGQLEPVSPLFLGDARDVKILPNDFPYYFEPGIDHVVVWSKVRGATDPETQQFTPQIAARIEDFIAATFRPLGISRDRIKWFKNTVALQSVPTLEHFHVMLRDAPAGTVNKLVGTAGALGNGWPQNVGGTAS